MPVTADDINRNLLAPFEIAMDSEGITISALAKKLKAELNAKKTDTFKATTKEFDDEGNIVRQTEEVIYSKPMVDWKTRQEARKDALAYRGIISAQKVTGSFDLNHSGSVVLLPTKTTAQEWAEQFEGDDGPKDT